MVRVYLICSCGHEKAFHRDDSGACESYKCGCKRFDCVDAVSDKLPRQRSNRQSTVRHKRSERVW